MADKEVRTYKADKIFIQGTDLQVSLYERIKKYDELQVSLLEQITEKLKEACGENDDPVQKSAALMVVLEDSYNLSAHALMLRSFIQRAAQAQHESRELSRFRRTLMPSTIYELSWNEADRFGV